MYKVYVIILVTLHTFSCADNGLLSLLDFVALNPHKSWRYVPMSYMPPITIPPITPPCLPPPQHPMPTATIITRSVAPTVHPAVDVDISQRARCSFTSPVDVDPSNVSRPLLQHTSHRFIIVGLSSSASQGPQIRICVMLVNLV